MIKIVAIGKIKEKANKELIHEYIKRIGSYTKLDVIEIDEVMLAKNASAADIDLVKQKESQSILNVIKNHEHVVLLDLKGKTMTSEQFSDYIFHQYTYGKSDLTFVIGGSYGVDQILKDRANYLLKLSDMTFPHQLARLFIMEQIYRAYKIFNNEPYHK